MQPSKSYETAYQLAIQEFQSMDLDEVAFNSSARLEKGIICIDFLGETFRIETGSQKITALKDGREPKITEKIILLHYLTTADGSPLVRQEIGFDNIPDAAFYYPTFKTRTIDQMMRTFKNDLSGLLKISTSLGAKIEESSETKARIKFLALPNIPITFSYWCGDDEIGPALQIVYDANIVHYLPVEDIVIITELLVHKIIKMARLSVIDSSPPIHDMP